MEQRIAIDCRFAPSCSGLGTYTRNIVRHLLLRGDPFAYTLFVRDTGEEWLNALPTGSFQLSAFRFPHYSVAEQLFLPRAIRKTRADLLFAPHFNVPFFCPAPFVVTIHDLILHTRVHAASRWKHAAYRALFRHAVRRARRVIAVSAYTAGEVGREYGSKEGIVVIREGVDARFCAQTREDSAKLRNAYGLRRPFFLYVGSNKPHKNLQMLVDAYAALGGTATELVLLTGDRSVSDLRLVPGVRVFPGVRDDDMALFYSAAKAFVTATLAEGYCLPIAEALACGCPVIATNIGAIPEIAGKSALLIEPTIHALVRALKHSPAAPALPPQPRSWQDAAAETAAVLHSAILTPWSTSEP